jgi:hypothetical protein
VQHVDVVVGDEDAFSWFHRRERCSGSKGAPCGRNAAAR